MTINKGVVEAIGNTPLIRLKCASEQTGCTILGKAEFMNPGQSVKDRAALFIIRELRNVRAAPAQQETYRARDLLRRMRWSQQLVEGS